MTRYIVFSNSSDQIVVDMNDKEMTKQGVKEELLLHGAKLYHIELL